MTIHSELVLSVVENLVNIVGTKKYSIILMPYQLKLTHARSSTWELMSPDIVVNLQNGKALAIEVESDMNYDFDSSMRQIRKYVLEWETRVIIPFEYRRFAPLYTGQKIRTYLWQATRIWECYRCGTITLEPRPVKPKCSAEKCSSNEQRLKGIVDFTLTEFTG